MRDNQKTKAELLQEVKTLRHHVTKLMKKDSALRLSDQKWYSLLKNTPDIIMIVDPEGTIHFINHTVIGITIQETIGKKVYDYISPKHHNIMRKDLKRVFQTGRSVSHEISGVGHHGDSSWYQAELGPIKQNGRIIAASIVTRDITEHKKLEQTLQQKTEHLGERVKELNCLYRASKLIEQRDRSPEEVLNELVHIIPQACRYPDKTCARITFRGREFKTDNFNKTPYKQRADIRIQEKKVGALEVYHLGKKPEIHERPFLKEEKELIDALAIKVGRFIEHNKAEENLRESEERYRTLFQGAAEGIIVADIETMDFKYVNPAICKMLGYTEEKLIQLNVRDIHPKEDLEYVNSEFKAQAQGEKTLSSNIPCLRKDGTIMYADVNTTKLPIDGRECNVGFFTDITERKKAEEKALENEERCRILVENQTDMVVKFDKDGVLLFVSPSYCKTFGKSQDELIGSKFMPLIHEEDRERVAETLKKVYKPPYTGYVEERALTKDGWRWQAWLNTAILNNEKKVEAVVGVGRDITEQKRLEQTLRESEEKYRTVVESAGESIAMFDNKGSFLFINERGAKQLGGKPKDLIGKTMWDLFPKKIADRQAGAVRKVIRAEKELKEISLTEQQGRPRWYNTTIVPMRNSSGKVTSALVMARDIHEQKQAEEGLNEYREKITHAERLITLGTLSAIMAHKLSSHLMAIRVSIENSLAELSTMSPPNTIIEDLNNSLSSLYNVVSEIDKIRNLANKPSEEIISEVHLKAVAERIVNLMKENAQRARVVMRLKDMHKLPTIFSNEQDIEQLFIALVENALQAADKKRNHRLVISGDVKDKQIELRFADTCGGIAKKNLDKIFEPFFTTRLPGEGTGLGLYIVENIVSKAGGKIRVESKAGKGSTFFITLPLNK
jgi:PAS domain S-box-containing protein